MAVKIQAWFRMKLVKKKLIKQKQIWKDKITNIDPQKDLVNHFYQILVVKRKIKPEEFFRAIDIKGLKKIPVETFIEQLISRSIVLTQTEAIRLAFIIDEDISGDITIEELSKTLLAYGLKSESNNIADESDLSHE